MYQGYLIYASAVSTFRAIALQSVFWTEDFFETAKANDYAGVTIDTSIEVDGDHGRIETREYGVATIPDYFTFVESLRANLKCFRPPPQTFARDCKS